MSDFPVSEMALSAESGISRENLKKTRRDLLTKDVDFTLIKNATCLTEPAALLVLEVLNVSGADNLIERLIEAAEAEKSATEKSAPIMVKLLTYTPPVVPDRIVAIVVHLPLNTRIVNAAIGGTNKPIRVKVKDSRLFVKKQRIPVKKTRNELWELDAPAPRRRGKIPGFAG